ncbi:MAG: adenylate kinase [Planctomycetales bacterium]|nr:adenylate kinase [Planctomycetales bacterium]
MFVILMGPAGVGKGTQSKRLTEYLKVPRMSSGEMLRQEIQSGSTLGQAIADHLRNGELVSDEQINTMVLKHLEEPQNVNGCLLDGYPRTIAQAETLDQFLRERQRTVNAVIVMVADPEELVRRLLSRGNIEGRSDDTLDTIRHRTGVYEKQTSPLVGYYRRAGIVHEIDAMGTPDAVFERIVRVFEHAA